MQDSRSATHQLCQASKQSLCHLQELYGNDVHCINNGNDVNCADSGNNNDDDDDNDDISIDNSYIIIVSISNHCHCKTLRYLCVTVYSYIGLQPISRPPALQCYKHNY